MRKTIIYLPEDTIRQLKYMALDSEISMAEVIRRAVAQYMKSHATRKRGRR